MTDLPQGVPFDPQTEPPIGPVVDATPRPLPARVPHRGLSVDLEPLHVRHAPELFRAAQGQTADASWAYLAAGPFPTEAAMRAHVAAFAATHDPMAWAIRPHLTGTADGWLTYGLTVAAGLMYRDSVEIDGLTLIVERLDGRRVTRVRLVRRDMELADRDGTQ